MNHLKPALTTTVAREYVHRASVQEVFLTDWTPSGNDQFTVRAQWPRSHSFFTSIHGMHDPLLLCETVRQTFPLLCHAAYGMPLDHQLTWSTFRFEINPRAMRIEGAPTEVEMAVRCRDIRYRRGAPASMSVHVEATRDGMPLAGADSEFLCVPATTYTRLLGAYGDTDRIFASAPAAPVAPSRPVGAHIRTQDTVLSPTRETGVFQLRVDTTHPVLFDHPVDHVPGMLLMEAARQATHVMHAPAQGHLMGSMEVAFHRYVEFDAPTWVHAQPAPPTPGSHEDSTSWNVVACQNDAPVFTATTGVFPV